MANLKILTFFTMVKIQALFGITQKCSYIKHEKMIAVLQDLGWDRKEIRLITNSIETATLRVDDTKSQVTRQRGVRKCLVSSALNVFFELSKQL